MLYFTTRKIKCEGIKKSDYEGRRDFRKTLTFTIDPEDAKDFDDAISFKEVSNDEYEIGIHIADVSHYVRLGSALDIEARERGTSVYLVDRTIPMLPEILSNDLCSLIPHKDRLTMSAVFIINKNTKIKSEDKNILSMPNFHTLFSTRNFFVYQNMNKTIIVHNNASVAKN